MHKKEKGSLTYEYAYSWISWLLGNSLVLMDRPSCPPFELERSLRTSASDKITWLTVAGQDMNKTKLHQV